MKKDAVTQARVVSFQYAARAHVAGPEPARIFKLMREDQINKWISQGAAIHKYLCQEAISLVDNSFEVVIRGAKGRVVNATRLNPKNFGIEIPDGEFFGSFHYTGKMWVCSLYSDTVDCSAICKELGGGGHPGAAGFQASTSDKLFQILKRI
jgi:nanoRNase/pAp phosphatase (c-di-AMP/oligoRNAs hydrolase)